MRKPFWILVAASAIGCGGSKGSTTTAPPDLAPPIVDAGIVGQHGQVIDYFELTPLVGFTVTDGTNTTTTDDQGQFVLPAPMDTPLAPTVTGPMYSMVQLAQATAAGTDVDLGPIAIPAAGTFELEQNIIGADNTKAVVQVIIIPTGACTSVAGGTLTVTSPADAKVAYFATNALPTETKMFDTMAHRPSAVIFDVDPSAKVEVTLNHPTCTLAPPGTVYGGAIYDGIATMMPAEPTEFNSVLVLLAQ